MKKIIFCICLMFFSCNAVNAYVNDHFDRYVYYICEDENFYSVNIATYDSNKYYFITPRYTNDYDLDLNKYHFNELEVSNKYFFLKYANIFNKYDNYYMYYLRYMWDNLYPDKKMYFCNPKGELEAEYESNYNQMLKEIDTLKFNDLNKKYNIGDSITLESDYFKYFDITSSDGIKLDVLDGKIIITFEKEGKQFVNLKYKSDNLEEIKTISNGKDTLINIPNWNDNIYFDVLINNVEIIPEDTLETKGFIILILLVTSYVCFKKKCA